MTKTTLFVSALAGCMLATMMVAPAAQAGFKRSAKAHKHHVKYVEYRIRHKYAPRHRQGHRPDCRQMQMRAKLTGNAYWRYAANSCLRDYYRKAY